MSYTTDRTWITGEVVTASYMNTYIRDNVKWLSTDKPMCRVYSSSTFSHNSSGGTLAVTFDSERFDGSSMHDTSSNTSRITIPTDGAGKYLFGGSVSFAANATGGRSVNVRMDGATIVAAGPNVSAASMDANIAQLTISTMYQMNAAQYAELTAYQSSGGTLNINALSAYSPEFWALWVGV